MVRGDTNHGGIYFVAAFYTGAAGVFAWHHTGIAGQLFTTYFDGKIVGAAQNKNSRYFTYAWNTYHQRVIG